MSDKWKFGQAFALALVGMIVAGVVWGFAYQFAYVNAFPVLNPPTWDESVRNSLSISAITCIAGVVPSGIFAMQLSGAMVHDRRKIVLSAAKANSGCGLIVLLFLSALMMPIWIAVPVSAALALLGSLGMMGAVLLWGHVRRPVDRTEGDF